MLDFFAGPTKSRDVDTKHFISLADAMYCCCPESCKKVFRCGVPRYSANDETVGSLMRKRETLVGILSSKEILQARK